MIKKIFGNPQAVVGLLMIVIVIICALFAPAIAPNDPYEINPAMKYHAADSEFPLGTDQLGRCELSRLIYGARYSLGVSVPMIIVLAVLGLFIGTLSVCGGEKLDRIITFICDVFISFPSLIISIAVISILGNGLQNIGIAVVVSMWAWFARTVRSYAVTEMGKEYILAARISGCGTLKLIFKHLIPNILPQFIVYFSTGIASAILMVSSFAFLGLGLPSGTPEWGAMLNDARTCLYTHPEMLIYPGVCILIICSARRCGIYCLWTGEYECLRSQI